nr:hypothetical protein [Tanacetum cinerariifolium]
EHCHQEASGRPSTGSGKLLEEAQPYEARHYLPSTIWRRGDKERAAAMIQAIDKMLKTKRIMRSLEKFVGGASESAFAEEHVQTMEETPHLVFETAAQGDAQSWISDLARKTDAHSSFNELLDTPTDFSNFIMHRLNRSDEQRNLYKALVEAYETDKAILDTYGDSTILKRRREDDNQEGPSTGSNRGSKRQKEGGADDQPIVQTSQHPEWFSQPRRPPSLDRAWNTNLLAAQGDAQTWISDLARQTDVRSSFNKLLDTPIDFSNFIMHRL